MRSLSTGMHWNCVQNLGARWPPYMALNMHIGVVAKGHAQWLTLKRIFQCIVHCYVFGSPAPHPDYSLSLNSLGNALKSRFEQTGSMNDLEEAISMHRESHSPSHASSRSFSVTQQPCNCSSQSFLKDGLDADLKEVIVMHRESLSLRSILHSGHSNSLSNLGLALRDRFKETRSMTDLEEAISMHVPASYTFYVTHQPCNRSSGSFWKGSMTDLEEAIAIHHPSIPCPVIQIDLSHLTCPSVLHLIPIVLCHSTTLSELLSGIILERRTPWLILKKLPPDRSQSFNNLAPALQVHLERQGQWLTLKKVF
jgi:Tetratricopeptide repeat